MINKTQMLKGILEGCVLKVVANTQLYPFEIASKLKEYGFEDISEGTIYPLLLRLEKEGLFCTQKIESKLGPKRKYFTLSEKGREELQMFAEVWKCFKSTIDNIIESGD